jgi:hypothetical protein
MEFFIRKNATLPILQVDVIKDGKLDYNFKLETLSASTVTFSMVDVDTNFYKVANALCTYESETNSVYYQFTKRNTKNIGRYEGEFKVTNSQGSVILPLRDRLYVNVIDSFVDPDFCCVGGVIPSFTPVPTPTPTPTPSPTPTISPASPGVYFGKFTGITITSGEVISNMSFDFRNPVVNTYVTVPISSPNSYAFIIIPQNVTQPSSFAQSSSGCDGSIPINVVGTVVINDAYNYPVIYNIYRSTFPFAGEINIWMCN